jgi:phage head maturation protease
MLRKTVRRLGYALLKMTPRPALNGLSIGYVAKDYELHGKGSPARRTLKAVDLVEVSLVTRPADSFARVRSVKARPEPEDEVALAHMWAKEEFEGLRRTLCRHN